MARQVVGHLSGWDYSRAFHELLHECNLRVSHFSNPTNIKTWSAEVRNDQWPFIGSVMCSDAQQLCFRFMHGKPEGHRNVGLLYMRLYDQFDGYWHLMKFIATTLHSRVEDHWLDAVHNSRDWAKLILLYMDFHAH